MIKTAVESGYADVNVARIITHARVSRPTFYEYFADKDDCFLAAHHELVPELLDHVRRWVESDPPERAVQRGVQALIVFADTHPVAAKFLMKETLAAGPRALDARDETVRRIASIIEHAQRDTDPHQSCPDLPLEAVVGGTHVLILQLLRNGERNLERYMPQLTNWIESYNQPWQEHRWRLLAPGPVLPPSPHVSELPPRIPPALSSGRSRSSSGELSTNHRERILFATAEMAALKGYTATTIADITEAANIDRRVFYNHFRDKQQAFLAVHELTFQQTMAVAASGFFSAKRWPERIWQGILAATQFQASYPTLTHVALVEAHAVGAPAVQRIDDARHAFTVFLQEGYQHTSTPPARIALDAIGAAISEIGYRQVRRGAADQMTRLSHHAAHLCLTPFLGVRATNKFIDTKLAELVDG